MSSLRSARISLPNYGNGTGIQAPPFPEDLVAVDTETTGLDPWTGARVFAIIMCDVKGRYLYVRLDESHTRLLTDQLTDRNSSSDFPAEGQLPQWEKVRAADWRIEGDMPCSEGAWTLEKVLALLESDRPKVFYNCKFDIRMIYWTFGTYVNGTVYDCMLLARLMLPAAKRLQLKIISDEVLGIPPKEEAEVTNWLRAHKYVEEEDRPTCYVDVPDSIMSKYAVGDVHRTMLLFRRFWTSAHDSRWAIFENEMKLCFVIMQMEDFGMRIDMDYTKEMYVETEKRIAQLDAEIQEIVGTKFNINSGPQCAEYLLSDEHLGLRSKVPPEVWQDHARVMLTNKGQLSVARDALKVYREYDSTGVCNRLMLRNMLVGMARYYKHFIERTYKTKSGKCVLRPTILQHTATTGRFSIIEPPLQTIPSRSSGRLLDFERDAIPDVRRCFIPMYKSWGMYAIDYSQIELRLIAYYAQEEAMIKAFADGEDIHDMTTRVVWEGRENLDDPVVWKRCRTFCKMVNFGLAYGMQEEKFHQELNTPMDVVRHTIQIYDDKFPGIKGLMEAVKAHIRKYGYLHTAFGRLQLPSKSKAYRGVNYLIQGTGAEILKYAMTRVGEWSWAHNNAVMQVIPIHDEILLMIHPDYDNGETLKTLFTLMEDFPQFAPLPIKVTCKRIKSHWSDTEEVTVE